MMREHQTRRCPLCEQEFDTRTEFENHYQETHQRLSRFVCAGCGAEFETRGSLIDHARRLGHTW